LRKIAASFNAVAGCCATKVRIMRTLTAELTTYLKDSFLLDWRGIHGSPHWARVRANGLFIAERNGANTTVVELFAFLHDVRREDDGLDDTHGARSAALAVELNGRFYSISNDELGLLTWACRDHSAGLLDADITVQTCWDADRLDLGRVGITPDPDRLCTPEARDRIAVALRRSRFL
jgi:uncharacterized protein